MAQFKYIGCYNDIDAVMMNNEEADEIVSNMKNNIGAFYPATEETIIDDTDINDKYHKFTTDGKYVVIYDVADRFEHIPLDLVVGNAQDEFIDIYEKIGD